MVLGTGAYKGGPAQVTAGLHSLQAWLAVCNVSPGTSARRAACGRLPLLMAWGRALMWVSGCKRGLHGGGEREWLRREHMAGLMLEGGELQPDGLMMGCSGWMGRGGTTGGQGLHGWGARARVRW